MRQVHAKLDELEKRLWDAAREKKVPIEDWDKIKDALDNARDVADRLGDDQTVDWDKLFSEFKLQ